MSDRNINRIFNYQGSKITFRKGNNVMVNATQMAKPFGKRCNDFLSSKSTNDLISSLSAKTGISATGLVVVNQGGTNQGTWLHEDLALIFAQWLSPEFYLWCNDRIKELLTTGVATISNDDETIAQAMSILQKRLERAKEEKVALEQSNKQLQEENEAKDNQIKEEAPRVLFSKAVETSKRSCLIGELAKVLQQNGISIGQNRLFKWLRENGYLCTKGAAYNQPTQKAMGLGLFEMKQTVVNKPDGSVLVSTTTKVTGKGQIYFVNKFLNGTGKDKEAC